MFLFGIWGRTSPLICVVKWPTVVADWAFFFSRAHILRIHTKAGRSPSPWHAGANDLSAGVLLRGGGSPHQHSCEVSGGRGQVARANSDACLPTGWADYKPPRPGSGRLAAGIGALLSRVGKYEEGTALRIVDHYYWATSRGKRNVKEKKNIKTFQCERPNVGLLEALEFCKSIGKVAKII